MEVWSGEFVIDYDKLHIFGCPTYFLEKKDKLDPRAKKAIFVGFSIGVKAYRLWYPETKKIVNSRNVIFDESMMLKKYEKENFSSSTLQQVELQSSVSPSKIVPIVEIPKEESIDEEEVPTREIICNQTPLQPVDHNE